jgi:hypothetical protein
MAAESGGCIPAGQSKIDFRGKVGAWLGFSIYVYINQSIDQFGCLEGQ